MAFNSDNDMQKSINEDHMSIHGGGIILIVEWTTPTKKNNAEDVVEYKKDVTPSISMP